MGAKVYSDRAGLQSKGRFLGKMMQKLDPVERSARCHTGTRAQSNKPEVTPNGITRGCG